MKQSANNNNLIVTYYLAVSRKTRKHHTKLFLIYIIWTAKCLTMNNGDEYHASELKMQQHKNRKIDSRSFKVRHFEISGKSMTAYIIILPYC